MSHSNLFMKSGFPRAALNNGIGRYVCQLQRVTIKFCKSDGSSRGVRWIYEDTRSTITSPNLEFPSKNLLYDNNISGTFSSTISSISQKRIRALSFTSSQGDIKRLHWSQNIVSILYLFKSPSKHLTPCIIRFSIYFQWTETGRWYSAEITQEKMSTSGWDCCEHRSATPPT